MMSEIEEQIDNLYSAGTSEEALAYRRTVLSMVDGLKARAEAAEAERDAAREEAARLREAQRWIPVSERLPESEYPEDGESISVQGFCNAGIWDGVLSPIYYIYRTGHWYFGQSRLDTVTHWRPLPEPPAEGGEE